LEDIDFSSAMAAPAPSTPQARQVQVAEEPFLDEITLPIGTDIRPMALSLVPYEQEVRLLIQMAKDLEVSDEDGRKEATKLGLRAKKLRLRVEKIEDSPVLQQAINFVKDARHLIKTLASPLKSQVEQVCKTKLTAYSEALRLAQARREAIAREQARALQARLDAEAEELKRAAEAKAKAAQDELDRQAAEEARKAEAEAKARAAEEQLALGAAGLTEEEKTGLAQTIEEETATAAAIVVPTEAEKALLQQTVEDEKAAAASVVAPQVVLQTDPTKNVMRTDEGSSFTTSRWVAELVDINLVDRKYLVLDPKAIQKDVDGGLRQAPGFLIKERLGTSFRG